MRRLVAGAVLTAAAVSGCSVQTLGAPKGGFTFSAEFTDVQTLVVGHSVQISDVRVGTVTGIDLDGRFKAHVEMQLAPGRRLPQGVTATIAKTSLLGENYVRIDLPAGAKLDAPPYLPAGADITDTGVQPDLESITEKVGPILAAMGGDDLTSIIESLAVALKDQGPDLNKTIKQLSQVTDVYAAADKDIATVVDGLGRLAKSLAGSSAQLDRLPSRLSLAADRIKADGDDLKAAVAQLVNLGNSFNAKVHARHAVRLQTLLARLDRILKAMVRGRKELKAVVRGINTGFLSTPHLTYKGQGMMQAWLAGILDFDSDASHITSNGGRGTKMPTLEDKLDRLLSPARPRREG